MTVVLQLGYHKFTKLHNLQYMNQNFSFNALERIAFFSIFQCNAELEMLYYLTNFPKDYLVDFKALAEDDLFQITSGRTAQQTIIFHLLSVAKTIRIPRGSICYQMRLKGSSFPFSPQWALGKSLAEPRSGLGIRRKVFNQIPGLDKRPGLDAVKEASSLSSQLAGGTNPFFAST